MTEQCVASDGLINPALFPAKSADLDPAAITRSASSMRTMGQAVEDRTTTVSTTWGRLPACYRGPEQERVYTVMSPAVTSATSLRTRFADAARHLDTYAGALEAIKPRLADLERRAAAFRKRVVGGVWVDASAAANASFWDHLGGIGDYIPGVTERRVKVSWKEDQDSVDENTRLLGEYAQILSDVSAAVAACANGINGLNTNVCTVPVETIPAAAFTSGESPMPWGSPVVEDRNCRESVGNGAYTFGRDLVQGAGQLVLGYNPANGDWFSGDAYGQAWGGLGDLVGSIVVLASPVGWVAAGMAATGNNDNGFSDWMYDRAVTVRNAGGALVGWDPNAKDGWHAWKEDGLSAGTSAVLSVGTFFIPGAGQVGAGLKAGSVGARVARISGAVSEFAVQGGSWVVKGGVKVVTGLRTAVKFDLDGFGGGVGPQVAVAGAGAGVRANPFAGLLNAMTEGGSRATPGTSAHRPVSNALLDPGRTTSGVEAPRVDSARVDQARVDAPETPRVDGSSAARSDVPAGPGSQVAGRSVEGAPTRAPEHGGDGSGHAPVREPAESAAPHDGTAQQQPAGTQTGQHAPSWEGNTVRGDQPDVSEVPREQRGDPRFDPTHPHYDGTPRGEHGNVGIVDPDVRSSSGLTDSGRLLEPGVVPEALRPYVDSGTVVNDNGVLRLAEEIEITFERKQAKHDLVEFERQLDLQQRSLNQMSLEDWTTRFDNFVARINNQDAYRQRLEALIADRMVEERGLSPVDAIEQAKAQLRGQEPLHGPDQRAGGNPDQITGMGDSGVNRSLGSQWRTRADDVRLDVRDALRASGVDPRYWGDLRMSVRLRLTDTVTVAV